MELKFLKETQLEPGDVLLCYSAEILGQYEEIKYGYSHVAINTKSHGVVEADSNGVQTTTVSEILDNYKHIAVLRDTDYMSENRITLIDEFVKKQFGKKFNDVGMMRVAERKKKIEIEATTSLENYFAGNYKPEPAERDIYFCSQLIVSIFIHIGIISESASIIMNPKGYSPEGIAADKAFGFFVGYIKPYEEYEIPENDYFISHI